MNLGTLRHSEVASEKRLKLARSVASSHNSWVEWDDPTRSSVQNGRGMNFKVLISSYLPLLMVSVKFSETLKINNNNNNNN